MRKALAIWVVAAMLVVLAGCGRSGPLSLDEYKSRISESHARVIDGLEQALVELGSIDADDYYALNELSMVLNETSGIFKSVYGEALDMNTPLQVKEFHQDLLLYYSYGEEVTAEMANAASFFQAALPMLTDSRNLALPDIPADSDVSRIKAASEEDVATMHGYTKSLKGMEPPEELEIYRDKLITLFYSIEEAVAGVERAVAPGDTGAFTQFQQEFPSMLQEVRIMQGEIAVYLLYFRLRIEHLLERGRELAGQIEEI